MTEQAHDPAGVKRYPLPITMHYQTGDVACEAPH